MRLQGSYGILNEHVLKGGDKDIAEADDLYASQWLLHLTATSRYRTFSCRRCFRSLSSR